MSIPEIALRFESAGRPSFVIVRSTHPSFRAGERWGRNLEYLPDIPHIAVLLIPKEGVAERSVVIITEVWRTDGGVAYRLPGEGPTCHRASDLREFLKRGHPVSFELRALVRERMVKSA